MVQVFDTLMLRVTLRFRVAKGRREAVIWERIAGTGTSVAGLAGRGLKVD